MLEDRAHPASEPREVGVGEPAPVPNQQQGRHRRQGLLHGLCELVPNNVRVVGGAQHDRVRRPVVSVQVQDPWLLAPRDPLESPLLPPGHRIQARRFLEQVVVVGGRERRAEPFERVEHGRARDPQRPDRVLQPVVVLSCFAERPADLLGGRDQLPLLDLPLPERHPVVGGADLPAPLHAALEEPRPSRERVVVGRGAGDPGSHDDQHPPALELVEELSPEVAHLTAYGSAVVVVAEV